MKSPIAAKTANVIIIEQNSSLRSGLMTAIKGLGFSKVSSFPECHHLFEYIEAGEGIPDWVITGLQPEGSVNGLHILDSTIRTPELHQMQVTFLLEKNEGFCVRNAFELGLLSWHFKVGSSD